MHKQTNNFKNMENEQIELQIQTHEMAQIEIDTQISTAKQYPRDIVKCLKNIEFLATIDAEIAEECFFTLPYRDEHGREITGLSIRLAEIVASQWSNIRCQTGEARRDRRKITAYAVVHDLETNTAFRVEVDRPILTKYGETYGEQMIAVTGKAAASIALRNAIFKIVPKSLLNNTIKKAKQIIANDPTPTIEKMQVLRERLNKRGVTDELILAHLGIKSFEEATESDFLVLKGRYNAVVFKEITVEELFNIPKKEDEKNKPKGGTSAVNEMK